LSFLTLLALVLLLRSGVKDSLGQPPFTRNPNNRQEKLEREILAYYVAHPDAKDTPGGILKWWFSTNTSRWRIEEVATALGSMTARGWLTSRKMRQAEQIYSLNKKKLGEITIFLSDAPVADESK
jgi:hypothetical protein